jgi:hypothetical protein
MNAVEGASGIEISLIDVSGWMFLYIEWTVIIVDTDMLKNSDGLSPVTDPAIEGLDRCLGSDPPHQARPSADRAELAKVSGHRPWTI